MADDGQHAPAHVAEKIAEHRETGAVEGHDVPWNPASWERADLPLLEPGIRQAAVLSEQREGGWMRISRRAVLSLAPADGEDPWAFFAAVMIWGHGPTGYGPARTAKILWSRPAERTRENLLGVVKAAKQGPAQAWDAVVRDHKTHLVGPAFGTKVAYFAAFSDPAHDGRAARPLIADANTSWAVWDLTGIPRTAYSRAGYLRYVHLTHRWAGAGGWTADEVERALFDLGKTVPRTS